MSDQDSLQGPADPIVRRWLESALSRVGNDSPETANGASHSNGTAGPAVSAPKRQRGLRDKKDSRRSGELVIRWVSEIQPREIEWVWPGRFPAGMPTLISGDKGSGKSNLTNQMAAIISRGGTWPDTGDEVQQGIVLMLNSEEDPETIIRPRLESFGADMTRIALIEATKLHGEDYEVPFSLALDIELLSQRIERRPGTRLVIIDTVSSYLGQIDSGNGMDIRKVLEPLTRLAQRFRFSVILCNHLNKGGGTKALYRSKDSIDIANLCRMTWLVAKDPDQKRSRILAPGESNFTAGPALAFKVSPDGVFEWGKTHPGLVADDLLAREAAMACTAGERGPLTAPKLSPEDWLKRQLADGPAFLTDLNSEGKALGYSRSAIWRALQRIEAVGQETEEGKTYDLRDAFGSTSCEDDEDGGNE
jgi:putative DNA primase/helicase